MWRLLEQGEKMSRNLGHVLFRFCLFPAALLAIMPGACFGAEDVGSNAVSVSTNYRGVTIRSDAAADDALLWAAKTREETEKKFIDEERVCYSRFFVNACLSDAKERRRVALSQVKRVEIEANEFKRASKVKKDDSVAAQKTSEEHALQVSSENKPKTVDERMAEHEEKLKEIEEKDNAEAPQRARNVEVYEQKVKEAEERKRKAAEQKVK